MGMLSNAGPLRRAMSELIKRVSGQELSAFGLIGASTGLASDIYEPLLPSTFLWFLASIAGFVLCVYLFQKTMDTNSWKEKVFGDGAIFFGASIPVICLLALTQFLFPADPNDNESVLARVFPAVESLQVSIGALDERLGSIDRGIERIGEDVTAMREDVKGLKRETSDDPRKELANLGVQWTGDNFLQALADGDMRITYLFLDGGMRPESARNQGRSLPIMLGKNTFNADEVVPALLQAGVDINYAFPSGNISGPKTYTMLGWAVEVGNAHLVEVLAENGAELNEPIEAFAAFGMSAGSYPLGLSVVRGHLNVTELLLELGADPSVADYYAYRALMNDREKLSLQKGEAPINNLISELKPKGAQKEKIDAGLRLNAIKRELTDVALEGMRTFNPREKAELDARYDALQVERRELVEKYDLVDN